MKAIPKIKLIFLLLIISGLTTSLFAEEFDDLKKQYRVEHNASKKVELLSKLAEKYLIVNPDSSVFYAKQALALSVSAELNTYKGKIYGIIGDILVMQDSLYLAEKYYDTCLIFFEKEENYFQVVGVLTVLGNINVVLENTSKGLQYYLHALKISLDNNYERRLPYLYLNIGTIQFGANNIIDAQNYYTKALSGFEKVDDSLNIGRVLSSIGTTYTQLNNYKLAQEYHQQAMVIFQELNSSADLAASYYNLSTGKKMAGSHKKAIEYLEISVQNIKEIDYTFAGPRIKLITQVEVEFGENYLLLGNFVKAKQHLLKAFDLADNNGFLSDSKNAAKNLSVLYERMGQNDSALFYHKIFKEKSEQLINVENIKKLANIDAQNKYEQLIKEEEIKRKDERDAQRTKNTVFIVAIIILLLLALVLSLFLKLGRNKVARMELQRNNLQNKLELRNKELTTHVMSQLKKNEFILEISGKLAKTLVAATPENKPIIERVIKELESENTKEVWKEFEIRFQNVHSDFYKKLIEQYPDLSSNELRLCAFIKLNLNTKEISSITHQSVNSIDVARSRLRQKLGLNKEDNLTAYLTGF